MAIRPTTHANNFAILKQLISFLAPHGISFRNINEELICAFLELLAKRVKSLATIKKLFKWPLCYIPANGAINYPI